MMAHAPSSSLRPLVLLMSRGKPRLGSFFSSSSYTAAVPPSGNCTPADPAVQPPAAPALPDCLSRKSPRNEELVLHPIPDPPKKNKAVINKSSPFTLENMEVVTWCTVDEDPDSSTPEPVPYSDNPGLRNSEGAHHPLPDPPNKKGKAVLDKPSPVPLVCTVDEDPKHPTPDGGLYSSTPEPVPGSDKPGQKPHKFEIVRSQLPDPPVHKHRLPPVLKL